MEWRQEEEEPRERVHVGRSKDSKKLGRGKSQLRIREDRYHVSGRSATPHTRGANASNKADAAATAAAAGIVTDIWKRAVDNGVVAAALSLRETPGGALVHCSMHQRN